MKLIDADELSKVRPFRVVGGQIGDYTEGFVDCAEEAREAIKNAPTVSAVPVVRCRECRHYKPEEYFSPCTLPQGLECAKPDDFCSYGQRKEADHD